MQINNLQVAPNGVKPIVHVSQFDVGREFQLKLYDGATAYTPPTGTAMYIDGLKPDMKGFSYGTADGAISYSGNTVTITTLQQMTVVKGTVHCEIRMVLNSNNIGTINFDMIVEESPINETTDISETDLPQIIALATEQMENAEAWATGKKNGVDVESTDPQYENNAQYYSEEASDSATAAADSATSSANSATESQSWARGGTGTRSGEDSDNAMYYANRADSVGTTWAREAEAWAVGERNGYPVIPGDETYENNSKYYCDESKDAVQECKTALTGINAYFAIMRLMLGTLYLTTEDGRHITTEDGRNIILDY